VRVKLLADYIAAGTIITIAVAAMVWFRHRHKAQREQILSEDALKHLRKCESSDSQSTLETIAGALHITLDSAAAIVDGLLARKLVYLTEAGSFRLTDQGREQALHLLRAHRLWESYLADRTGYAEKEWHEQAEEYEHRLSRKDVASLSSSLGHPTHDPHGDPIPSETQAPTEHGGKPLKSLRVGDTARIVHIEDEPPIIYEELARKGIHSGMRIRMKQISDDQVRMQADGDELELTAIEAANISVAPLPVGVPTEPALQVHLADLRVGEYGQILAISPACRGQMRRRLMDLGFLPGTTVKAELGSPLGDPVAYRVRGVQVALRAEQSKLIAIRRVESS
jgi:DtxR family Mn-dependent transcriptional regulator